MPRVHVRACLDQREGGSPVAVPRGVNQPSVVAGRGGIGREEERRGKHEEGLSHVASRSVLPGN